MQTPLAALFQLSSAQCMSTADEVEYMTRVPQANAVGCLMYAIVCTTPDISHVVNVVNRYMGNLKKDHWNAVK